ncbi:CapA family protein [Cohnella fermenti]|uniref:CapA family protein n=1 Tax=Cohnella fermenti TaxID=2565925 RepID=A0A4V3WFE1_9BACL|nr:CapA family protein [Cohnella fermenti]THF79935.1 CapA family protein [Cohnella fermenti]
MTYSRTHSRRKHRRRARILFYVNVLFLVVVLGTGAVLAYHWMYGQESDPVSESPAESPPPAEPSSEPSPTAVQSPDNDVSDDEGMTAEPSADKDGATVNLAFVGDILLAARVEEYITKNGVDYPFRNASDLLQAADIAAANLENPITERGTPAEDKTYVFKGSPESLQGLKNAGFDIVSLANNHTLDQGWEGLSDTMDYLDDIGIDHVGSGSDDTEAYTAAYYEVNGIRVAYLSVTNVVPVTEWKADKNHPGVAETYDTTRAVQAIKNAKELADIVVVMVHWGKEKVQEPIDKQTSVGHVFIDAGADLVIGSHPHVLQGFETYKGKWIAYSLGNFVFTSAGDRLTQETGVLQAACTKQGECGLTFVPMLSTYAQPSPMSEEEGSTLLAKLSELSSPYGVSVHSNGEIVPSSGALSP